MQFFFKLKLPSLIFVGARGVSKQIKFSTGEPRLTASPGRTAIHFLVKKLLSPY